MKFAARIIPITALAVGLTLSSSIASAVMIPVLNENFNRVTGLTTANGTNSSRTVQNVMETTSGQLPAGTMSSFTNTGTTSTNAASVNSINIRRADNAININTADRRLAFDVPTGGINGQPGFFGPVTNFNPTAGEVNNNLLVLGDNAGTTVAANQINGSPTGGASDTSNSTMTVTFPFSLPPGFGTNPLDQLTIRFSFAFDGFDLSATLVDTFDAFIDGNTDLLIQTTPSVQTTNLSPINIAQGQVQFNVNAPSIPLGPLSLVFRLTERGFNTQTAVGIDNISINADVIPLVSIPEPAANWLLLLGCSALIGIGIMLRKQHNNA